jgi:hypothetical protein
MYPKSYKLRSLNMDFRDLVDKALKERPEQSLTPFSSMGA